jgi:UDP-glucose 4-epimerase
MRAWIIGSGGLLGHAITREAGLRGAHNHHGITLHSSARIPWVDEQAAIQLLELQVAEFAQSLESEDWAIIWAAGASIVASDQQQTESELRIFAALARAIRAHLPHHRGTFFVASSAGGVYAASAEPPFAATSIARPNSPYGRLKLGQEAAATELCASMCSVVIGRFSNLYGPARNKEKQQGLIQRLCASTMQRTAINLYVSMDTVRDYLFVDDAARLVWDAVDASFTRRKPGVELLLLASGQGASIAEVIATVQSVTHRRVPLALGSDPTSDRQAIDLRFLPSLTTEQLAALTPLPTGVRRIFDAILGGAA